MSHCQSSHQTVVLPAPSESQTLIQKCHDLHNTEAAQVQTCLVFGNHSRHGLHSAFSGNVCVQIVYIQCFHDIAIFRPVVLSSWRKALVSGEWEGINLNSCTRARSRANDIRSVELAALPLKGLTFNRKARQRQHHRGGSLYILMNTYNIEHTGRLRLSSAIAALGMQPTRQFPSISC